jgi:uncharacterized membrane protein YdjX (TVP38/TMEM64 family)
MTGAKRNHGAFAAWRLVPLIVLIVAAIVFFALDLHEYLTFQSLRTNREQILAWIASHSIMAAAAFVTIYAVGVVFVPPSGAVMTVAGGFLFGAILGAAYVVVGATIGATLLFLVAKLSVGDFLRARAGPGIRKMEAGFQENEMSYMLVLRLVPLFPFWLVNLAPAFLGVRLRTYVIGTFLGIIPGTAVFATFGAGLGSIFDTNEKISLSGVITPQILAGLLGLALLSLIPVVYKRFKRNRAHQTDRY